MKKLNNKGITLVELIVSFALVSVSVIYFYQTVYTVRSLYAESQSDTAHYVKANFALRLADEYFGVDCEPKSNYNTTKNVFLTSIDEGSLGQKAYEDTFCYVPFTVDGKSYKFYKKALKINDESPYGYDAMLVGNTKILGTGSNKYFYFDGDGDYIKLSSLPGCDTEPENKYCIKWSEGFSIEFKAKWDALNVWSRIIDLGNGADNNNIVVANFTTNNTLSFDGRKGKTGESDYKNISHQLLNNTLLELHEYKIIYDSNSHYIKVYKDRSLVLENTLPDDESFKNVTRTYNYIGKSNWVDDGYFKGNIYYVKIDAYLGNNTTAATGDMQTILNINANNYNKN